MIRAVRIDCEYLQIAGVNILNQLIEQ